MNIIKSKKGITINRKKIEDGWSQAKRTMKDVSYVAPTLCKIKFSFENNYAFKLIFCRKVTCHAQLRELKNTTLKNWCALGTYF